MDIFPTAMAAAGAKSTEGLDGQSFLPLLKTGMQVAKERDLSLPAVKEISAIWEKFPGP